MIDPAAEELLDEAEVAARLRECVGGGRGERVPVGREADPALSRAVRRLDHDGVAELLCGLRHLRERAADERARLRDAGRHEPLALLLAGDGDLRRLGRERVRHAEPFRNAGGDRDGVVAAGSNDAVDVLGPREPLDRGLVLDRDDRAPVGIAKAGG